MDNHSQIQAELYFLTVLLDIIGEDKIEEAIEAIMTRQVFLVNELSESGNN
jgi:hypothetical protein